MEHVVIREELEGLGRDHQNGRQRWTVERWLQVLTFLLAAGAFIFSAGFNFAELSRVKSDVAAQERFAENNYVRKDVLQLELQNLRLSIISLNRELADHTRALRAETSR